MNVQRERALRASICGGKRHDGEVLLHFPKHVVYRLENADNGEKLVGNPSPRIHSDALAHRIQFPKK